MLGLHFTRKRDKKESENLRTSSFFLSRPAELRQNTELKMLNFFCFDRRFRCAAANRIRLGSDRPKHKRHFVASRYGVFY